MIVTSDSRDATKFVSADDECDRFLRIDARDNMRQLLGRPASAPLEVVIVGPNPLLKPGKLREVKICFPRLMGGTMPLWVTSL